MTTEPGASTGDVRQAAEGKPKLYRSVLELALELPHDDDLLNEIKSDPLRSLVRHASSPGEERRTLWISGILGLITILVLVAIVVLPSQGKSVPPELVALGSAALGGLVGTQVRR